MTGKGSISHHPNRRIRLVIAGHAFWLALVCALGAWWGDLVIRQASRIAQLEKAAGLSVIIADSHWARTQRMVYWESGFFFALLLASAVLLSWLYLRDLRRTRGLQAFFASVTHELRTPLTSIRLQAESIADNLPEGSERHLVDRLLEDTLRLEAQVERTLELARVEGGGPVFTQQMALKPWLFRQAQIWRQAYGEKVRLQARFEGPGEEPWIDADPAAMQVILRNLIENSVRHSRREPVEIEIAARADSQGAVDFSFKDSGAVSSFPPSAALGELFQKGSHSQGAGVGLYLVQVLMRRMGGEARFLGGSGFEVLLRFPRIEARKLRAHG